MLTGWWRGRRALPPRSPAEALLFSVLTPGQQRTWRQGGYLYERLGREASGRREMVVKAVGDVVILFMRPWPSCPDHPSCEGVWHKLNVYLNGPPVPSLPLEDEAYAYVLYARAGTIHSCGHHLSHDPRQNIYLWVR